MRSPRIGLMVLARTPPELVDALRSFAKIARALADYLDAIAEIEESYGVPVEELLRRVFADSSVLQSLSMTTLAALYEAALRIQQASRAIQDIESLSAGEKRKLAEELRSIADRIAEAIG
jgi:pilus assembly protein TadC